MHVHIPGCLACEEFLAMFAKLTDLSVLVFSLAAGAGGVGLFFLRVSLERAYPYFLV